MNPILLAAREMIANEPPIITEPWGKRVLLVAALMLPGKDASATARTLGLTGNFTPDAGDRAYQALQDQGEIEKWISLVRRCDEIVTSAERRRDRQA